MKKSVLSFALILALCLGLCPSALGAELPRLDTPTDLEWGISYMIDGDGLSESVPGSMSWRVTGTHQGKYDVSIYNTADPSNPVYYSFWEDWTDGFISVDDFTTESAELDSGDYYFTVQAIGDGVNYADSEIAQSEIWTYTKPDARLETPQAPAWNSGLSYSLSSYDAPYFGGLYYEVYFAPVADTPEEDWVEAEGAWFYRWDFSDDRFSDENNWSCELWDETLSYFGPGYYRVRVRALSYDITQCQNSAWSDYSRAYEFTETYKTVQDQLDAITDTQPQDIRAAVQSIEDLRAALAADQGEADGVAAKLADLEARTGVEKTVEVDQTMAETFDAEKVSFVGAALNDLAEGATQVKLDVGPLAEDTDLVIPTLYKDTVVTKFSMDVEGVADTSDLKVPVRITLPVPSNINPAFLVILHYDSQGVPQTISAPELYVYQDGGQWMASFLVDHFSDFAMTEAKSNAGTLGQNGELAWKISDGVLTVDGTLETADMVVAACQDDQGRFLGAAIVRAGELSAKLPAGTAAAKLLWLGDKLTPKCAYAEAIAN